MEWRFLYQNWFESVYNFIELTNQNTEIGLKVHKSLLSDLLRSKVSDAKAAEHAFKNCLIALNKETERILTTSEKPWKYLQFSAVYKERGISPMEGLEKSIIDECARVAYSPLFLMYTGLLADSAKGL